MAYCCKPEGRTGGPWEHGMVPVKKVPKLKVGEFVSKFQVALRPIPQTWHAWQQHALDTAANLPDERSVHWWWGPEGCDGKTTVVHELLRNYEGLPVNGELGNVLSLATDTPRRLYVVVAPRDQRVEDFPYDAIELLKDGIWMKGKYEVKAVHREMMVHVFVFANVPPDISKLTADRWKIYKI